MYNVHADLISRGPNFHLFNAKNCLTNVFNEDTSRAKCDTLASTMNACCDTSI